MLSSLHAVQFVSLPARPVPSIILSLWEYKGGIRLCWDPIITLHVLECFFIRQINIDILWCVLEKFTLLPLWNAFIFPWLCLFTLQPSLFQVNIVKSVFKISANIFFNLFTLNLSVFIFRALVLQAGNTVCFFIKYDNLCLLDHLYLMRLLIWLSFSLLSTIFFIFFPH